MRMPGQHGNFRKTIQNLKVVQTRPDDKVILVSGAVPGAKGGYVIIRPAIKKSDEGAPQA
jgi:large subunit ribosomal protein L3